MKKAIRFISTSILCFVLLFVIVSCAGMGGNDSNNNNQNNDNTTSGSSTHVHSYSDKWSYDEKSHWHSAICGHDTEYKDKGSHEFCDWNIVIDATEEAKGVKERTCSICGYIERQEFEKELFLYSDESNEKIIELTDYAKNKETIVIPNKVTSINSFVFRDCTSLKDITIPNTVNSIGKEAFENCTSLSSVELPNNLEGIKERTFYNCSSLKNIVIPEKVKYIDEQSFENCTSLTSITIPSSVVRISEAFYNCTSLIDVYYDGTVEDWCKIKFYSFDSNSFCNPMFYASNFYIQDNNGEIENNGKKYSLLKDLIMPNSITSIGDYQFYNMNDVINISFSNSIKSITKTPFEKCSSLTNVYYDGTIEDWCNLKISASANPMYYASNFYILDDNGNVEFNGKKYSLLEELIIPDSVTRISTEQFYNFKNLKSIIIPDTVTKIGFNAFYGVKVEKAVCPASACSCFNSILNTNINLKEVVITSGTRIEGYTFFGCISLTSVKIPNSVTSIIDFAFSGCTSLKNITIPDSVTSIGDTAFGHCSSLTNIVIPSSVKSIGSDAFEYCKSLECIEMNASLEQINTNAFKGCSSLVNVYYDGKIDDWCKLKFATFNNITYSNPMSYASNFYMLDNEGLIEFKNKKYSKVEELTIPSNISSIGSYQFNNFKDIKKITIPDSVTSIGERAFGNCNNIEYATIPAFACSYINKSSLKEVTITSGETIDKNMFENCLSIMRITIPSTIKSIGTSAFSGCQRLIEVINKSSLAISAGSTDNGYIAYYAKKVINDISESTLNIDSNGFVTIDDGMDLWLVNYLGDNNEVVIPNNITKINRAAFINSTIRSVIIPDSVTSIGRDAFKNCCFLSNVTIGNNVDTISSYAFYECISLTSIKIPSSVTKIDSDAFSYCSKLIEVINKSSLKMTLNSYGNGSIARYAKQIITDESESNLSYDGNGFILYNDGTNVWVVGYTGSDTKIVIPSNVNKIYMYAFLNCSSLTSIEIPNSVTSIDDAAFYNCTSLTSIKIPNSVTSIGGSAFKNCSSLTSIEIPNSVTSIGYGVFSGCISLTKVYYKGVSPYTYTITSIGRDNECLTKASWYYFTSNSENETNQGNWWYYDTDGKTIIEKVIS